MTLSDVLSIALALAMTYTLISMLALIIKEAIAAKLQWRGKDLEQGIHSMVTDVGGNPPVASGTGAGATPAVAGGIDPAALYKHPLIAGLSTAPRQTFFKAVASRPSYVPARNFTLALVDVLCEGKSSPAMTAIETSIDDLPDGALKKRLKLFADEAGGDLDALKSQFDKWFDDTMDRLSGVYKRRLQVSTRPHTQAATS